MPSKENSNYIFDLEHLVDNVPGGIIIYKVSTSLEILYFNDAICGLSGHSRKEYQMITNIDPLNMVYKNDRLLLQNEIIAATKEDRKINCTYRMYHKNGSLIWIYLVATCVSKKDNAHIYYAILMDISEERKTQKMLRELVDHDTLTNVLNRNSFERKISRHLYTIESRISGFIMIDIDNFKRVNDFLGHTIGDEVLCKIANMLVDIFGKQSLVARLGGDEFAVFIKSVESTQQLLALVDEFCSLSKWLYFYQDTTITVSCSAGIALTPKEGKTYLELYTNADKALLYAKNNGKEQYHLL